MYLQVTTYGGIDWNDSGEYHDQISYKGNYNIPPEHLDDAILNDICEEYPFLHRNDLETACRTGRPFKFAIPERDDDGNCTEPDMFRDINGNINFKDEGTFYPRAGKLQLEFGFGQAIYTMVYWSYKIPDESVRYVAIENFLHPEKGVPCVCRFWHEPYETLAEAEQALAALELHDHARKELRIVDIRSFYANDWWNWNHACIALMEALHQGPKSPTFHISPIAHLTALEEVNYSAIE